MARTATETAGPLAIYARMQESLLNGDGADATILPAELLAEDVVVETPYGPPGNQRYEGREAWLSYYRTGGAGLLIRFDQFRELATHQSDDPEVIVVEYELTGTVIATGVQSSVTCIAVLRIRDGLIKHWREYQDIPAITEALTRPPQQDPAGADAPAQ
ncbi:nuclear transport factor 2 family protein [Amycolatopsis sp. YIM 10]|uniref:nuclear transport factor 2 family protein n=1 Tax=Amycolatopsis sp. YIM 10 TaxID=2653857 RepID=UPI0012901F49|nr:nuclear transport factor 2 family protein [Amycolatopsis sp. YIM 10]QFU86659.1 putative PhzA/B-like protein [Amycolatopsis sp. YIM 10]